MKTFYGICVCVTIVGVVLLVRFWLALKVMNLELDDILADLEYHARVREDR